MWYNVLANVVVVAHLLFIVFVVCGGVFVWRWRRLAWLHLPTAVWGALIEFRGWICPLTPLENKLRIAAGEAGYTGGFIEHYILPVVYPADLTRGLQIALGVGVVVLNVSVYVAALLLWRRRRSASPDAGR